jgi:2-amino-4-hydroxy-6-hydroxymethyldihydropteridine diphosphokinase
VRAVIGLGSNLGDRRKNLAAALARLEAIARVERVSRVRETAPVGGPPQPDYLNAAALIEFEGDAHALLSKLMTIEAELGRERRERWGARTIDLDLLWIDGVAVDDPPRLVVPHPRLRERAFALEPLREIEPGARDPRTGEPL